MTDEATGDGTTQWGLLGPHTVVSERRSRTLGLSVAVRTFNDLAVPGIGGVWFAKPLLLSSLGIAVAAKTRRQNIEVANAIEALACRLAFGDEWPRDARMRGHTKLRNYSDWSYASVRRPAFYVTQPMRQQTVQPLLALGLVESGNERFNSFTLAEAGHQLVKNALESFKPYNKAVNDLLVEWVTGERREVKTRELTSALSPIEPLTLPARKFIGERLIAGGGIGGTPPPHCNSVGACAGSSA